jgi:hypothetical protein
MQREHSVDCCRPRELLCTRTTCGSALSKWSSQDALDGVGEVRRSVIGDRASGNEAFVNSDDFAYCA